MSAADRPSTATTSMDNLSTKPLTKIVLPDLVSYCTFDMKINPHCKQAMADSSEWLLQGDSLNQQKRQAFHGLKAGLLSSICYPDSSYPQLRVCCDFTNYLFHFDDLSDDMDNRDTKTAADVVFNSLYHPYSYQPTTRIGKMTIK
jgi:hypothetical protein